MKKTIGVALLIFSFIGLLTFILLENKRPELKASSLIQQYMLEDLPNLEGYEVLDTIKLIPLTCEITPEYKNLQERYQAFRDAGTPTTSNDFIAITEEIYKMFTNYQDSINGYKVYHIFKFGTGEERKFRTYEFWFDKKIKKILAVKKEQNPKMEVYNLLIKERVSIEGSAKIDSILDYPEAYNAYIFSVVSTKEANRVIAKYKVFSNSVPLHERNDVFRDKKKNLLKSIRLWLSNADDSMNKAERIRSEQEEQNTPKEFMGWKLIEERPDSVYTYYITRDFSTLRIVEEIEKEQDQN